MVAYRNYGVMAMLAMLVGCSGGDHKDLDQFMEEVRRRPTGTIEPLPTFRPYESYIYSAATLRSPFDPPVKEVSQTVIGDRTDVKPDFSRQPEYLEGFNLGSLSMVGTLAKGNTLWALIDDGQGGIHRVRDGNYMGKNHGRIVVTSHTQVELIEIVTDGLDGWVQRPRTLQLVEKE